MLSCSRRSVKQAAKRLIKPIALSAAPKRRAPASELIIPPSNAPTTERPSTVPKSSESCLHSVAIGGLLRLAQNCWGTTTFADSEPRCAQHLENLGLDSAAPRVRRSSRKDTAIPARP